jgi:hypothetical protein
MLIWHPPCTNFVMPKALIDDAICRPTADVHLTTSISDSNLSVLLTRALTILTLSIVHDVVGWPEQSSVAIIVLPLWNLSIHW